MIVSRALFIHLENAQRKYIGPALRSIGQRMLKTGFKIQGDLVLNDRRNSLIKISRTLNSLYTNIKHKVSKITRG
jgi:hypothetical protein